MVYLLIYLHSNTAGYIYIYIHIGCPRRNVADFERVFLMLKYTDITQNTYIRCWTVTEIMAREKWGFLAVPNTATCTANTSRDSAKVLESGMQFSLCPRDGLRSQPCYVTAWHSHVIVLGTLRKTMTWCECFYISIYWLYVTHKLVLC